MRILAALLVAFVLRLTASAAEPWLKPNDVVALVGGEDMVALAEEGWLETLVTWAQPKDRIRFRSLAWEGDTVFEQRRDLNYPTLEAQLDQIGATVVICQFGKMESFAGKEGVAAFSEAYEKLLARLSGENERRIVLDEKFDPNRWSYIFDFNGMEMVKLALTGAIKVERVGLSGEKKRRIALVLPARFGPPDQQLTPLVLPDLGPHNSSLELYRDATTKLARKNGMMTLNPDSQLLNNHLMVTGERHRPLHYYPTRDGVHLTKESQYPLAVFLRDELGFVDGPTLLYGVDGADKETRTQPVHTAIVAKNRMWFHYSRPQNWAFLAGNRINQPSSRDHLDPTKRWFPEEMEQWLPLIEAKEKEIWALAAAPR